MQTTYTPDVAPGALGDGTAAPAPGDGGTAFVHGGAGATLPAPVLEWLAHHGLRAIPIESTDALALAAMRGRPRVIVVDARARAECIGCVARLKGDSYTSITPTIVLVGADPHALAAAFAAGADEVLGDAVLPAEVRARLDALLSRSERDLSVHPSTRLPGAPGIEREYARRMQAGEQFGVCYVDLDHFKEFNDRYSYHSGDRVIRVLANILHDVAKGMCGAAGFVGHIGGDDFIVVAPESQTVAVCEEIVAVFDALVPLQYSSQDRATGYYFGKDRRGQLHRVPLMTVSIGVVTNAHREFTHPAQISELATEMKSYAKTFHGSVYVIDRRHDDDQPTPAGAARAEASR